MKKFLQIISFLLLFSSINAQTVTDIEGNVYKTVKIGNQEWMAENLRVTKLNDGKKIPAIKKEHKWTKSKSMAYAYYDYNKVNKPVLGCYYNYYTIETKKLCPNGWHIPSTAEWNELIDNLGGSEIAGIALKSANKSVWEMPKIGPATNRGFLTSNADKSFQSPTNSSGFSAVGGGMVDYYDGRTKGFKHQGNWWSLGAYYHLSFRSNKAEYVYDGGKNGFNVRCVKD